METLTDDFSTALVVRSGPEADQERTKKKELNADDIAEILARLPVKSLLRFKCVSKHWYSLITSPNFISIHSSHSKKISLLLYSIKNNVTTRRKQRTLARPPTATASFGFGDVTESLTFSGEIEHAEVVGCFNGVVCLSLLQRPHKYALWNPATRQVREIGGCTMDGPGTRYVPLNGKGKVGWNGSGFCFDPVTNAFKVVEMRLDATDAGETRAQVNVFSTATSSWTKKNIVVPYPIQLDGFNLNHRCHTFVNGYMHWHIPILQDNTSEDDTEDDVINLCFDVEDMYILSFNIIDEVFQRIEVPFPRLLVYYHLAVYRGSLAIFVHNRTDFDCSCNEVDVWVLNDCGGVNQSWSKMLTCRPSIKVQFAIGFLRKDNNDLVLLSKEPDCSLYLYDPENGETKKFGKKCVGLNSFLYSESLASLN